MATFTVISNATKPIRTHLPLTNSFFLSANILLLILVFFWRQLDALFYTKLMLCQSYLNFLAGFSGREKPFNVTLSNLRCTLGICLSTTNERERKKLVSFSLYKKYLLEFDKCRALISNLPTKFVSNLCAGNFGRSTWSTHFM